MNNAIPLAVQPGMVKRSGVQFRETIVEAGRSPFLSKVDELVHGIVGAVERV
jgi:hypothetical protein